MSNPRTNSENDSGKMDYDLLPDLRWLLAGLIIILALAFFLPWIAPDDMWLRPLLNYVVALLGGLIGLDLFRRYWADD